MYITELNGAGSRIIGVALHSHAHDQTIADLKLRPGESVSERAVAVADYPLFIIRKPDGCLDAHDLPGAMSWIRSLDRHDDDDHLHGTVFRFDADRASPNHDLLDLAPDHRIDGHFLTTVLPLRGEHALLASPYQQVVADYDLDGLDGHFDRLNASTDSLAKSDLAKDGYLSLLAAMEYDFACGKLTMLGVAQLLPMVSKAERLLATTLWQERSDVRIIMLQDAIAHTVDQVAMHAELTLSALAEHLAQLPVSAAIGTIAEIHRNRALVHELLAEHLPEQRLAHWRKAVAATTTAIETSPPDADWARLLHLVYRPYAEESPALTLERGTAQAHFTVLAERICGGSPAAAWSLTTDFKRLREHFAWDKRDPALFPEAGFQVWLERAKAYQPGDRTIWDRSTDAGHLFFDEGVRLRRVDLLTTAIMHFSRALAGDPNHAMEVYYTVKCHEAMATIAVDQGQDAEAAGHLTVAIACYAKHLDVVRYHFSSLTHYVEFLERILVSPLNVPKPSIAEIRCLAVEVERDGRGFYSGPGLSLTRLALHEGDEDLAIFHLTRLLLLHECCMDREFATCRQQPLFAAHQRVANFLDATLRFCEELGDRYYLHTPMRWPELQPLDQAAVAAAWQARQVELRNRPALEQMTQQ